MPNNSTPNNINDKVSSTLRFIKEYYFIFFLLVLAIFLLFDYWIYTSTFNLHQANFFNYFLSFSLNDQFLLIFILYPIIITMLVIAGFKILYNILMNIDNIIHYNVYICLFILLPIALFGDIYIYDIIEYLIETLKTSSFVSLSILIIVSIFIINMLTLIFLINISHYFYNIMIKSKHNKIFYKLLIRSQLDVLHISINIFFIIKLSIYWLSNDVLNIFNLVIFILISYAYVINKKIGTNHDNNITSPIKHPIHTIISTLLISLFIVTLNSSIYELVNKQYKNNDFWENKINNNSLTENLNFGLLFNTLKINQEFDEKITINILNSLKKYNSQYKDLIPVNDKRKNTLHKIINQNIFALDNCKLFYIPFNDKELFFLKPNTPLNIVDDDSEITILTLVILCINNQIVDIGYIKADKEKNKTR